MAMPLNSAVEAKKLTEAYKKAGVTLHGTVRGSGLQILIVPEGVEVDEAIAALKRSRLFRFVERDSAQSISTPK